MSFGDLQAFITDQEKLSVRIESEREGSPVRREFGGDICDRMRRNLSQEPGKKGAFTVIDLKFSQVASMYSMCQSGCWYV